MTHKIIFASALVLAGLSTTSVFAYEHDHFYTVNEATKTVVVEPVFRETFSVIGEKNSLKPSFLHYNHEEFSNFIQVTKITSANPSILEVQADQSLLAKSIGETQLNVTYQPSELFKQKYAGYTFDLKPAKVLKSVVYRYLYDGAAYTPVKNFIDTTTTPKYVYVGEKGMVKSKVLPDFKYAVMLDSNNESVVKINNHTEWEAVKAGKAQVLATDANFWTSHKSSDDKFNALVKEEEAKANIGRSIYENMPIKEMYYVRKFGEGSLEDGYWNVNVIEKDSMFRLYNPNSGEHFYTASRKEAETLWGLGWKDEDIAWVSVDKNDKPVYRLYNPNAGDHHYTLDAKERDELVKLGWKYEGESWYSGGNVPLYRVYNPNAKAAGAHHFTKSTEERDALVAKGWKAEGIAWYGK